MIINFRGEYNWLSNMYNCDIEYDFVNGGFSQERPKVGKESIGRLVKIKSEGDFDGFIGVLTSICEAGFYEVNKYRFTNVELYEEN